MIGKGKQSTKKKELSRSTSERMEAQWERLCDWVEEQGDAGRFLSQHILRRLSIEAPVTVGFVFACVILHLLNVTLLPGVSAALGVRDTFQAFSVWQYVRLVTHVFGHDGLPHLKGNMVNLLLVGPSAEHAFGSQELLLVFGLVAVTSAVAHIVLGRSNSYQLGASGICFSLILLNSLVAAKSGKIPVSFVLTALLWISDEVYKFAFSRDGVSHHAHLTGALVGTVAGYMLHRSKEQAQVKSIARMWQFSGLTKKKKS